MSNTEPVRLDNRGVPRRLTLDLMREMRHAIYKNKGLLPDGIRCAGVLIDRYLERFGDRLTTMMAEDPHFDGIPIHEDVAGAVPVDQMEWTRTGWGVIGVLADLDESA